MKKNVHILYGQYGYIFSAGMHNFGQSLDKSKYNVTYWEYGQHRDAVKVINASQLKNAVIGMSLGANACAWIANDKTLTRPLDLIVGYDPTVNGPSLADYPIGPNVKRAICYRQTGYLFTSLFVGRGYFRRAAMGPKIEEVQFTADHLYVPYMQSLHDRTRAALEAM